MNERNLKKNTEDDTFFCKSQPVSGVHTMYATEKQRNNKPTPVVLTPNFEKNKKSSSSTKAWQYD